MENIDINKSQRLFEIKKNQLKMVKRRGFDIKSEEPLLSYSLENFLDVYVPFAKQQKKSMRNVLSSRYINENGDKLLVYFADISDKKQLGVDVIGDIIKEADEYKAKNIIIITPSPLTSKSVFKMQSLLTYNFYTFMENEMAYDPTEHYLTPEHKALSPEDQRDFLIRNDISIDQLPTILTTDMISRYYGFQTGQVIQIDRINLFDTIVQKSISYRIVKDGV